MTPVSISVIMNWLIIDDKSGGAPALPGGWRNTHEGKAILDAAKQLGWGSFAKMPLEKTNAVRRVYKRLVRIDGGDDSGTSIHVNADSFVGLWRLRSDVAWFVTTKYDRTQWEPKVAEITSERNLLRIADRLFITDYANIENRCHKLCSEYYKDSEIRDRVRRFIESHE